MSVRMQNDRDIRAHLGAAVALAVGVFVVACKRAATDPCAPGDPIADWSSRQPAIANAFEASGHPSWAPRLDATTRAARTALTSLANTGVAVCKAAVAANRKDDRARACLDADRAVVRALFEELAHANRAMVDRAPLAATLVPRGVQCRDVAAHEVLRSDHALGGDLHRVKAKSLLHAPQDIIDEAKALAVLATEAGAAQVEGEAKLLLGALQRASRQDAAAWTTLDEAAIAATRARDDRVAALARLLQAEQVAAPERAEALGELARAAVERAGDPAELRGRLETVLGAIATARGELVVAERHHRRAIAARAQVFGAGDPRVAGAHQHLGNTLHRLGRTQDAKKELETALAILERALGTDHPELADMLDTLGTLAADDERYAEAAKLFDRARALRVEALGADHPDVAISLDKLAKLASRRGAHRDALAYHERALAIVEAKLGTDALEVVRPLAGLATVHAALEEVEVARGYAERAYAIAKTKLGAEHPQTRSLAKLLDEK